MIGSGLKKLAKQNGMSVSNGVAYGSLKGFATTIFDGSGCKVFEISTSFPQLAQKEAFYAAVNAVDYSLAYGVQRMEIGDRKITVIFTGTMKKVEAFTEWFFPLLAQHGAAGAHLCAHCGADATAGGWYLVNGVVHRFHDTCAANLESTIQTEQQDQREQDDGSYVQGFFGALLGSLLGAIAWAIVYSMGYVAALIGLLMGWLADKGYNLLHGKRGKGKIAILIIVIILGVIIGNFGGDAINLVIDINAGNWPGFVYGDIPFIILDNLIYNPEYVSATISSVLTGLLFAGLGVFALLRKSVAEVANVKFKKLS